MEITQIILVIVIVIGSTVSQEVDWGARSENSGVPSISEKNQEVTTEREGFQTPKYSGKTKLIPFTVNRKSQGGEVHPHGKPEAIIHFTPSKPVVVDHEAIEPLRNLAKTLKDYKIAVYTIVGAFRQGKSFLMDYVLRYLYAHYKSLNFMENTCSNKRNWMGDKNEPLRGFSWKAGKNATTSGIVLWSDIFLHEKNGEKIAIAIMDTQGLFDVNSRMQDSTKIFALNSLASSFLIFNVKGQVDEQQLQYLQLVSEYAKLIKKMSQQDERDYGKPFQNLLYLVRDWPNGEDHQFGLRGGTEYINSVLNSASFVENKRVREFITNSYDEVFGYLMPHPGKIVDGSTTFDGSWGSMDDDFKTSIKNLVEWLFKSENIKEKVIMGTTLMAQDYYTYLSGYCNVFKREDFPEIGDIYDVTIDKHMMVHIAKALEVYRDGMRPYETNYNGGNHESVVAQAHIDNKAKAMNFFINIQKMGSPQKQQQYTQQLDGEIEIYYKTWRVNVLKVGEKFNELSDEHKQRTRDIEEKAEYEKRMLETRFTSQISDIQTRLDETNRKHDQERENWNQLKEHHENEARRLTNEIEAAKQHFQQEFQKAHDSHNVKLQELEAEHKREREDRDRIQKETEDRFNAQIADLKQKGLEDTAMYTKAIEDHQKMIENEKELRAEQERVSATERQQLLDNQIELEKSMTKTLKDQKKKYKKSIKIIADTLEAEKAERKRQEQEYQENNKIMQNEFVNMQEKHSNDVQMAMAEKNQEIQDMKYDLENRFNMERHDMKSQMDNLKMSILTRSNGSISICPDKFVTFAVAFMLSFIFFFMKK